MKRFNPFRWGRLQSSSAKHGQVEEHNGEIRADLPRPQAHGFAYKPSVGAKTITASQSGDADNSVIILCAGESPIELSEGDSLHYSAGGALVHCKGGKVVINGGALGGLIDIALLTTEINKLVTAYNSHSHTANGTSQPTTQQVPLVQTDYENTDVTHG